MFAPSRSELKNSIPQAIRTRLQQIRAEHETLPEWQRRWKEKNDMHWRMARECWIRWTPTELLQLAKSGPARSARNDASAAIRELEREEVVETYTRENCDRIFAIRLRQNDAVAI